MDNKDLEISRLKVKLMKADRMAKTIDDFVERGILGARSLVADARLVYGDPYKYKFDTDLNKR